MTFFEEELNENSIIVDAGNVTAGARNWEIVEMEFILKGYREMGYNAVNAGHREATLEPAKLREIASQYNMFVSANLFDETDQLIFPPYRIVEMPKGFRVGIIGVLDERFGSQGGSQTPRNQKGTSQEKYSGSAC